MKNAEALEADALDEFHERLEVLLGLAGEADDESGADRETGNAGAEALDEALDMLAGRLAAHGCEHVAVDVLERHVHVLGDLWIARDRGDEIVAPVGGMRVEQAHPEVSLDLADGVEEVNERGAARGIDRLAGAGLLLPQVHAEVGGVLADEIDLANAFRDEAANLGDDGLDGAAAMAAAHLRDDAEAAGMIATPRQSLRTWCARA